MRKKPFPRPDWHLLPREGCIGFEARVCLVDKRSVVAMLRLSKDARTDVHPAPYDIHVLRTAGSGFVNYGGEIAELTAGESVP